MKGLWVIWVTALLLSVLDAVVVGGKGSAIFLSAALVINSIGIATSIIVEEIKNVRKD